MDLVSTLSRAGAVEDAKGLWKDTCGQSTLWNQIPVKVNYKKWTYSVLAFPTPCRTSASQTAHQDFDLKASTISDCCCTEDGKPLQHGRDRPGHLLRGLLERLIGSHKVPRAYLAISQLLASMY